MFNGLRFASSRSVAAMIAAPLRSAVARRWSIAGSGMMRYREFDVKAPEYQPMAYFSSDVDEDPAAWLSNIHGTYSTDAVPGDAAEG